MARIVVIGAGALGRFFAASFVRAGHDAVLIAREPGLADLRARGVELRDGTACTQVGVPVQADCATLPPADLVLLCVKAADLPAALDLAAPLAATDPAFVTVQNGVEAPAEVQARFPGATVIASRVHGFFELRDGAVHHVGVEPSLAFGAVADGGSEACALLAAVLADAGIAHRQVDDIRGELWGKFLLAAALGGTGAALGVPAGRLCETEQGRAMLAGAMAEIVALGEAQGIAWGDDPVGRTLAFAAGFPPEATTSLQRDLAAGRPSEYDCLTEAVLRMGREAGLDQPVHRAIAERIAARGLLP